MGRFKDFLDESDAPGSVTGQVATHAVPKKKRKKRKKPESPQ